MRARVHIALSIHLLVGMAGVSAAGTVAVRSDNGILWLESREAPAPEVFTAVARETGIRFVVAEELRPIPVNLKVEGVEIERAIRKLVKEFDAVGYAMSYRKPPDGKPRLTEVAIYGAGGRSAGFPGASSSFVHRLSRIAAAKVHRACPRSDDRKLILPRIR